MSDHEKQGTGFDSGASGYERQGRRSAPNLDRKSTFLSRAELWNKAGVRLGTTTVTDEIDYIQYGGGIFRRGEWHDDHWLFEQCDAPTTFHTNKLDP